RRDKARYPAGPVRPYNSDRTRSYLSGPTSATCVGHRAPHHHPESTYPLAREVAGQRERRDVVGVLAAIDLQVFEHPLDIEPGLLERDHLDPVDHADVAAAGVAELTQPLPHPPRSGVVSGDRQRVRAAEFVDHAFDVRAPERQVVETVAGQPVARIG